MRINVQTTVGNVNYNYLIDEPKEMDAMHKAIVLGNPPKYCNCCSNNQYFRMDSNKATSDKGTFTYINVMCTKCFAKATLGQYKAGGYFWHKFEKYEKDDNGKQQQETPPQQEEPEPEGW